MAILDIHTHRPAPCPEGVVSLRIIGESFEEFLAGQLYSAGIHPWDVPDLDSEKAFPQLEAIVNNPQVAAIGECGVDLMRGGPLYRQLQVFRRHVELSESVGKPLIIHCVKGDDIVCGLRRDLRPTQPWVIHGYRGKPGGASALLRAGCHLSFGEKFNPGTVAFALDTAPDRILAETDESPLPITEIIANLNLTPPLIASNTKRIIIELK